MSEKKTNLEHMKPSVEESQDSSAWGLFDEDEYFYMVTDNVAILEHFIADPRCREVIATDLDGYHINLVLTARNGSILYTRRTLYMSIQEKKQVVDLLDKYPKCFAPRSTIKRAIKHYLFL